MGVKGFIWLVLLTIVTLFIVQNLPPVSLVFFGSKSVTLPLSIWMLLFTITGIIVSLIIQTLTNINYSNYTKNLPKQKTSYSGSPPRNKSREIKQQFKQKSEELEPVEMVNPTYTEPYDDFEFFPEKNERENGEARQFQESAEDNFQEEKIEGDLQGNQANQISDRENQEEMEVDSELKNKPRSPSLYSYKPKEKTKIRPTPKPKFPPPSTNQIYDANYRVIIPAPPNNSDRTNQNENEENEGEWDF
jgi:uncharacterized integral membrane protein